MYSSTLSLTSVLDGGVGGQCHHPGRFTPREKPGTHCIEGWVGPKASVDRCGKSRPHRGSIPDRPGHSESLYRLSYRGPRYYYCTIVNQLHDTYMILIDLSNFTFGYPKWISPVMLQNKKGIWNQCWNAYQEESNIPI